MLRCESKRRWSTSAVWSEAAQRLSQQTDIYVLLPINCNLFLLNSSHLFLYSSYLSPFFSVRTIVSPPRPFTSPPPLPPPLHPSPPHHPPLNFLPLISSNLPSSPFVFSPSPPLSALIPIFPPFFQSFAHLAAPSPPLHSTPSHSFLPRSLPPLPPSFFFSFSQQSPAVLQSPLLLLIKLREIGCPRPNNP